MNQSRSKSFSFAKLVTIFAICFGIGVGLCGLDYFLAAHNIGKSTQEFGVGPLDGASIIVMFLSAVGLMLSLIAWATAAIFGLGRDGTDPQRLLDEKDETNEKEPR
jgi:hypothetical protein